MNRPANAFLLISLTLIWVFISGCATKSGTPEATFEALKQTRDILSFNSNIRTTKGRARIAVFTSDKNDAYQIAWAAAFPDRLRITFLLSGTPIETLATDGSRISIISHTGQHAPYHFSDENPDMDRFVHVPVLLSEVIRILSGRSPIQDIEKAALVSTSSQGKTYSVKLSDRQGDALLELDRGGRMISLKKKDLLGDMVYHLKILKTRRFDASEVPALIEITDRYKRKLKLDITFLNINPLLKDAIFKLTPEGS